jgi:hypothetical protein
MEKIEKIECLVKGKILKLSPEAFKLAEGYFGAVRTSEIKANKPIELSKPLLIPRKPELSQPIELPVIKPGKSEVTAPEVVEPVVNNIPKRKAPAKKTVKKAEK